MTSLAATIFGRDTKCPSSPCSECGKVHDMATGPCEPHPGNFSLCIECGCLNVYGEDMRLRAPTEDELFMVAQDKEAQSLRRILEIVKKRGEAGSEAKGRKMEVEGIDELIRLIGQSAQAAAKGSDLQSTSPGIELAIQARALKDALENLRRPCPKEIGALIIAKKGLCSGYKFASTPHVAVVSKVFDSPLRLSDRDGGSNHFGRDLDIAILTYDRDSGAVEFMVDSRYFEAYTGEIA